MVYLSGRPMIASRLGVSSLVAPGGISRWGREALNRKDELEVNELDLPVKCMTGSNSVKDHVRCIDSVTARG